MSKQAVINTIFGILSTAVLAGGVAMAVPKSRNFVLDKIAEQSQIYKSAMDNNSKLKQDNKSKSDRVSELEQDNKSKSDRVSELETIQANLRLEIEKVKNDAKLSDEEKSAKIASLQKQLDLASATATATIESSYLNFFYQSKYNTSFYFSKDNISNSTSPSEQIVSSAFINELTNPTKSNFRNLHTNENLIIKLEGYDSLSSMVHKDFSFSSEENLPSTIKFNCKDADGNVFDTSKIDAHSKTTYKINCTDLRYTLYSLDEVAGSSDDGQNNIIKNIAVDLTITLNESSSETRFLLNTSQPYYDENNNFIRFSNGDASSKIDGSRFHYSFNTSVNSNDIVATCDETGEEVTFTLLSDTSLKFNGVVFSIKE